MVLILFVYTSLCISAQLSITTDEDCCSPLATEACWLRRLVVEDLLDLFHHLVGDLGKERHRLDIVLDLLWLGRLEQTDQHSVQRYLQRACTYSEDDCANVRVLHAPRQTELCDSATKLLGDLGKLVKVSK